MTCFILWSYFPCMRAERNNKNQMEFSSFRAMAIISFVALIRTLGGRDEYRCHQILQHNLADLPFTSQEYQLSSSVPALFCFCVFSRLDSTSLFYSFGCQPSRSLDRRRSTAGPSAPDYFGHGLCAGAVSQRHAAVTVLT